MKPSTSTLNPFAQSYVPLFQREVKNEDEGCKALATEGGSSDGHSSSSDDLKLKGQQIADPHGAPSHNPHQMESKFSDEESEMDLAYLQMMFPGVADQSLVDVYSVNGGDLEAAIEMLTDLESVDGILDVLDPQDAQKPDPSGECSSMKVLNATGESSSSSGPSDVAVLT